MKMATFVPTGSDTAGERRFTRRPFQDITSYEDITNPDTHDTPQVAMQDPITRAHA